jgi:hypothetical protein
MHGQNKLIADVKFKSLTLTNQTEGGMESSVGDTVSTLNTISKSANEAQHATKYSTSASQLDTIPRDFKSLKVPMRFHVESFARRMGDREHFENLERIFIELGVLRDDEPSCDPCSVIRAENLLGFRVPRQIPTIFTFKEQRTAQYYPMCI